MGPGQGPSCSGLRMAPDRKGEESKRGEELAGDKILDEILLKVPFTVTHTVRDLMVFWVSSYDLSRLAKPPTLWGKVSAHA